MQLGYFLSLFWAECSRTCGAAMNAQLFQSLEKKWLASAISFTLIMAFFVAAFVMFPHPLPTAAALAKMPWWAPLGGLVGAVQVYAGLTLVQKVGAGPFVGITVTDALVMSLVVDHNGRFHMPIHAISSWRVVGAALMIGGVSLIARN